MRTVTPVKKTYLDAEAVDGGPVGTPPQLVEEVRPTAPEGVPAQPPATVVARFTIDAAGRIHDIEISRANDPRLVAPAIQALSCWKLLPARRDGRPIPTIATVQLTFDPYEADPDKPER